MSYLDGIIYSSKYAICQSRWLNGLKRGPKAGRLLGMRVRIRPGAWVSLSLSLVKCCVVSGRGLCDGPVTRPEDSYRVRCF